MVLLRDTVDEGPQHLLSFCLEPNGSHQLNVDLQPPSFPRHDLYRERVFVLTADNIAVLFQVQLDLRTILRVEVPIRVFLRGPFEEPTSREEEIELGHSEMIEFAWDEVE